MGRTGLSVLHHAPGAPRDPSDSVLLADRARRCNEQPGAVAYDHQLANGARKAIGKLESGVRADLACAGLRCIPDVPMPQRGDRSTSGNRLSVSPWTSSVLVKIKYATGQILPNALQKVEPTAGVDREVEKRYLRRQLCEGCMAM